MPDAGTLYEVLTAANPILDLAEQPEGPVTTNSRYLVIRPQDIVDWPDFAFRNIAGAYGHLFSIEPIESDAIYLRNSPAEINSEPSVDTVIQKWNGEICR